MNVLHIVSAKVWGGGETAALSMCKTLKKNGYGVYVVIDGNEKVLRPMFEQVGTVCSLKVKWINLWGFIKGLRSFIQKNDIQVVHTHTGRVIPLIILAIIGMPVKLIAYRHNAIRNKKDIIHKIIYKRIDAFICVSNLVKKCQELDMPDWMKQKTYVVYNGVEKTDAHAVIQRKKDANDFVVGYAGRIVENKGLLYLIDAFMQMADHGSVLKIAGDDNTEYAQKIKRYLSGKKCDNIEWLGYVSDMDSFYDDVDVMVCPSIVREAFGLSICEAMYHGKPVIASNNGAQIEIIDDNVDGILVKPGSADEIAEKLRLLRSDNILCNEMGKKAKKKIYDNFTMSKWMANMNMIYTRIVERV
ncbi:putative glycosyl transferase family 1 protein [Selenomonas ruminantium subsp. lactilytica TAM6421]|uniref:Putative glycosyl transferase family 1 protein n=1 Tax=Selenomonas ruminantium subsp. lactilytica (strain NBRC 103574 / TAM6421) TaxID=927704 RepID=I0GUB8_SELRL|nr:glycosyltransferase family 4 protein [Selenomonas ruminantium]BAL84355.1 putative glycosyl transferase family 1 protein [Selenomonas ruminantium subsp. lactilytica TAM6421]